MTKDHRKARIAAEADKGNQALSAAKALLDLQLYNDAVARMYYAAFHFATAALVSVDVQPRSHRALQSLFSLHMIRPGKLSFQRAKELRRLQSYREAADYDAEFRFDKENAQEEFDTTQEFVSDIRKFLGDNGWL